MWMEEYKEHISKLDIPDLEKELKVLKRINKTFPSKEIDIKICNVKYSIKNKIDDIIW